MKSFGSRFAGTVIAGIGWLLFILLFLAFYAGRFDFWQNVATLLVSALIAIAIVAVMWTMWALH
ncbi:MAG: hypothetical protein JSV51_03505 [Candidatus Bathyarchaeota archaeon]|nr:MAG: hypothetical protein JSV51_03505 [Candidatus Bathyarchaeota archaeon]